MVLWRQRTTITKHADSFTQARYCKSLLFSEIKRLETYLILALTKLDLSQFQVFIMQHEN